MNSEIKFAEEKIQKNFEELKNSKTEDKLLEKITRSLEDIKHKRVKEWKEESLF